VKPPFTQYISQEELTGKLNVVRHTISKREQGLSVPDAGMLISISEVFETPVSVLPGETNAGAKTNSVRVISQKLEPLCLQLAQEITTATPASLVLHLIVRGFGSHFRSPDPIEQPLPGLGLQPSRNRGHRNSVLRV
jgi:transcriptional regulator with XRE-family HTH domain